jgi:hypothetical protein
METNNGFSDYQKKPSEELDDHPTEVTGCNW